MKQMDIDNHPIVLGLRKLRTDLANSMYSKTQDEYKHTCCYIANRECYDGITKAISAVSMYLREGGSFHEKRK